MSIKGREKRRWPIFEMTTEADTKIAFCQASWGMICVKGYWQAPAGYRKKYANYAGYKLYLVKV